MKKPIVLVLLFLVGVCFAQAQEKEGRLKDPKAGISVNLSTFNISGLETTGIITTGNSFSLPINVGKRLRLEPEAAGLIHRESFYYYPRRDVYLSFGMGIFLRNGKEDISILYGIRAGGISYDGDLGLYISPAVGAEYFLSKRFSLGGEIQISNTIIGRIQTIAIQTPVSLTFYF